MVSYIRRSHLAQSSLQLFTCSSLQRLRCQRPSQGVKPAVLLSLLVLRPRPSQEVLPAVLISLQSPSTGVLRPAVLLSQRVLPAVLKHPTSSAVLLSLLTITV